MTAGGRLFRCLLLTGTVVWLAAGAHVLGGGTLPTPVIVLALTGLVLASVMQVMGRQLSLAKMAAVLGVGQVLLHEAFGVLSAGAACHGTASPAGHEMGYGGALCLSPVLAESSHTVGHGDGGAAMTLAHLLAVAVTALLISRAEAALWKVVAWLRPVPHAHHPVTVGTCKPSRISPGSDLPAPPWRTLAAVGVRGPPRPGVRLTRGSGRAQQPSTKSFQLPSF